MTVLLLHTHRLLPCFLLCQQRMCVLLPVDSCTAAVTVVWLDSLWTCVCVCVCVRFLCYASYECVSCPHPCQLCEKTMSAHDPPGSHAIHADAHQPCAGGLLESSLCTRHTAGTALLSRLLDGRRRERRYAGTLLSAMRRLSAVQAATPRPSTSSPYCECRAPVSRRLPRFRGDTGLATRLLPDYC